MEYDLNVGRWIQDHPDYWLRGLQYQRGYEAVHRKTRESYVALTLDELHAQVPDTEVTEC